MSIALCIFLFIFFCKPYSYRMSNETLHHGATSNSFGRRHRGYVFSLHAYAAGPLSTFPSFIHLKHNTGGVILGEFGFCFYFKLLPASHRRSKQSQLNPHCRPKFCELRLPIYFSQNDEKIARTISNPVILIENQDAISCASYLDTQSTSPSCWVVAQYNI